MRISELARRSGVPVPTIKYYLRESLLPSGTTTAPNQAVYDDLHVRRLRLIRVLLDLGRLSVVATRDLLCALDDGQVTTGDLLAATHARLGPTHRVRLDEATRRAARAQVAAVADRYGWRVSPDTPDLERLVEVLATLRVLEMDGVHDALESYAAAATRLAERDLQTLAALAADGTAARRPPAADRVASVDGPPDGVAGGHRQAQLREAVVTATVLGDAMLSAMYAVARQSAGARLLPVPAQSRSDSATPA
jgi:DNA-binding transcriptional MerR regulator